MHIVYSTDIQCLKGVGPEYLVHPNGTILLTFYNGHISHIPLQPGNLEPTLVPMLEETVKKVA